MKRTFILAGCFVCCVVRSLAAPDRSTREILIGEVDIAMGYDSDSKTIHESSTNKPFAKNCIVNNKIYAHSQMIPSEDQNAHCLCVAGEVYCWWQTYTGSFGSGVTNMGLTNQESSTVNSRASLISNNYSALIKGPNENSEGSDKSLPEASGEMQDDSVDDSDELADLVEENEYDEDESLESNDILKGPSLDINFNSTATSTPLKTAASTRMTTTCLVMGRTYRQGDVLPHSTGNCVECSCGDGGRIECSPKDCIGLRPQNVGEDDDFELFDTDRDRGIEGSF